MSWSTPTVSYIFTTGMISSGEPTWRPPPARPALSSSTVGAGSFGTGPSFGNPCGRGIESSHEKKSCAKYSVRALQKRARASSPSGRQNILVVTAMLSLMNPPTGFLQRLMASLYACTSGAIWAGVPKVKQSAPTPSSPASANVAGLEQASQMGGFGFEYGFGSTSRLGILKYLPSNS